MLSKSVAILSAITAVSATCAYPPAINLQSAGNSVTRPDSSNPATIGQESQIVWDATGWGSTVDIFLLRGPGNNIQLYSTLATGVPNIGAYDWTPDCSLTPDTTEWGLMIVSEPTCSFQWSMQFGLNPPAAGTCSNTVSSSSLSSSSVPTLPTSSTSSVSYSSQASMSPPHMSQSMPTGAKSEYIHDSSQAPEAPAQTGSPYGGAPYGGNGGNGGAYSSSNCTSTSTVWVKPTTSAKATTNGTYSYTPVYSNSAASSFGISLFGLAAAAVAALC